MEKSAEPVGTGVQITQADLCNALDRRDYQQQLALYAADPMGGGVQLPPAHLEKVCDDLTRLPHAIAFLARLDGEAVGFATCLSGYSTFRARPLWNIHDLAVSARHRGHGIGRALLRHIAERAQQAGCCKLTLEVRADNLPAASLYQRFGFSASQTDAGQMVQYLFLEKRLRAD